MKNRILNGLINALIHALIVVLEVKRGDEITGRMKKGRDRYYFLLIREDYMLSSRITDDAWVKQDLYAN